jgi:hypothetical protein
LSRTLPVISPSPRGKAATLCVAARSTVDTTASVARFTSASELIAGTSGSVAFSALSSSRTS